MLRHTLRAALLLACIAAVCSGQGLEVVFDESAAAMTLTTALDMTNGYSGKVSLYPTTAFYDPLEYPMLTVTVDSALDAPLRFYRCSTDGATCVVGFLPHNEANVIRSPNVKLVVDTTLQRAHVVFEAERIDGVLVSGQIRILSCTLTFAACTLTLVPLAAPTPGHILEAFTAQSPSFSYAAPMLILSMASSVGNRVQAEALLYVLPDTAALAAGGWVAIRVADGSLSSAVPIAGGTKAVVALTPPGNGLALYICDLRNITAGSPPLDGRCSLLSALPDLPLSIQTGNPQDSFSLGVHAGSGTVWIASASSALLSLSITVCPGGDGAACVTTGTGFNGFGSPVLTVDQLIGTAYVVGAGTLSVTPHHIPFVACWLNATALVCTPQRDLAAASGSQEVYDRDRWASIFMTTPNAVRIHTGSCLFRADLSMTLLGVNCAGGKCALAVCPAAAATSTLALSDAVPAAGASGLPTVVAGTSLAVRVIMRTAGGALASDCYADVVSIAGVLGAAAPVAATPTIAVAYQRFFSLPLPTVPGPFVLRDYMRARINGETLPATALALLPGALVWTVLPGPPTRATTTVLTEAAFAWQPVAFAVSVADRFGNILLGPHSVYAELTASDAGIRLGNYTTYDPARGAELAVFTPPAAAVYTLTVYLTPNSADASSDPVAVTVATYCAPGSFRPDPVSACFACPTDTYAAGANSPSCDLCEALATTGGATSLGAAADGAPFVFGATAWAQCSCRSGAYTHSVGANKTAACVACPYGASCAGKAAQPQALPGFGATGQGTFVQCPRAGACQAQGGTARCAAGYTGLLCKDCEPRHYRDAAGACAPCPTRGRSHALMGAFFGAVVTANAAALYAILVTVKQQAGAAAAAVYTVVKTGKQQAAAATVAGEAAAMGTGTLAVAMGRFRTRLIPPSLSIVISALQIVALISQTRVGWPAGTLSAMAALRVFSLDLSLFAPGCSVGRFEAQYMTSVLGPVAFPVLLLAGVLAFNALRFCVAALARKYPHIAIRDAALAGLLSVGPLAFLPLARATLILFDCTRLADGSYYLDAELEFRCYGAAWNRLLPVGLFGVAVWVAGIPLVITTVILRRRTELFTDPTVLARYGGLYRLFRRRFYWFPIALLAKKLGITLAVLLLSARPGLLMVLLQCLILGSSIVQSVQSPYYFPIYERIDRALALVIAALLGCGVVLSLQPSGAVRSLAAGVSGLALAALAVVVVVYIALDVREIVQDKVAKRKGRPIPARYEAHLDVADLLPAAAAAATATTAAAAAMSPVGSAGAAAAGWFAPDISDVELARLGDSSARASA